ncbi:MAG: hypothetical protein M1269_04595 [Chloroflexi bacterium]|nr:hypothetical protein [Chloroflexota bacterium]
MDNLKLKSAVWICLLFLPLFFSGFCRAAATPLEESRACQTNLSNLVHVLDRYAADHGEHYPRSLAELIPKYLDTTTVCPAAGYNTYRYSLKNPEQTAYYIYCAGFNHPNLVGNMPAYDSDLGFLFIMEPDDKSEAGETGTSSSSGTGESQFHMGIIVLAGIILLLTWAVYRK